MYPETWARFAAITMFFGFNVTFFPQFIMGYAGMPRRYHVYPAEFQVYHVMSSAGALVLAVAYLLPLFYLPGRCATATRAGNNPWGATGLEWQTPSPPPKENFAAHAARRRRPLRLSPGWPVTPTPRAASRTRPQREGA